MDDFDNYLFVNKCHKIYKINYILIVIILITIYIIFTYQYQTYYQVKGKMIDNKLEIKIYVKDIPYAVNNDHLLIDNKTYDYQIIDISNLYIDDDDNNYCYLYLEIINLYNIDNYVYEIKFPKENKRLIAYLKDYL